MDRRTFITAAGTGAAALSLGAVSASSASAAQSAPSLAAAPAARSVRSARTAQPVHALDTPLLLRWFRDTYHSIEAMTTDLGLATDKIDVSGSGGPVQSRQTSPTNIGCGLWSTVAAAGLGVIGEATMHRRLERTVRTVEKLERHHGFWLNWYDAHDGSVLTEWPGTGDPVRPFLSSVDNAWLITGLRIAADASPALRPRVARILATADWSYYYTPYDPADPVAGPGQLRGGFWPDTEEPTGHHYGALNTEPRMASYLGIADGSLPADHYWHLLRTMVPENEQEQHPQGSYVAMDGIRVWQGHYTHRGRKIVPSWGGSMFEALMVPLFVPEAEWSPQSWGLTHQRYVRSQIEHGMEEAEYGYWGFSPPTFPRAGTRSTVSTPSACRSTAMPPTPIARTPRTALRCRPRRPSPTVWSPRTPRSSLCRTHRARRSPTCVRSTATSGPTTRASASGTPSMSAPDGSVTTCSPSTRA